jgi:hypothetical protein
MAFQTLQLHKKYNHAYMLLERAGEGQERDGASVVVVDLVVELLKECGCYGRLFYSDWESEKPKKPGWQTDRNSRPYMLEEYKTAIRQNATVVYNRAAIVEMMNFQLNEKGRAEAIEGAHDDRVMARAICWQGHDHARFTSVGPVKPIYIHGRQ